MNTFKDQTMTDDIFSDEPASELSVPVIEPKRKVTKYDKLIRDHVPKLCAKKGIECKYRQITDPHEFHRYLRKKLIEEVNELLKSEAVEEFADVAEVLDYLAKLKGYKLFQRIQTQDTKRCTHGDFSQKLVLLETIEAEVETP